MDINKANEISATQVYVFMIASQISFGILSLASDLAEDAGHDGWISTLLAGLFVSVIICIMMALLRRFRNLSILDINQFIFGKIIGNILNCVVIAYLIYSSVMTLRMFVDIIRISALKLTPGLAITIFILIPFIYLSWYGLKYICRYSNLKVLLLIVVASYYLLLRTYFRDTFLMPVGAAGLIPILKSSYVPYLSYMGFDLLTIFYQHIKKKDKSKALRFALLGNLTTMAFYMFTVIFLTGFFGEVMLAQLQYPIFSLARAYRAPVLERLDLFFIALWFPIMGTVLLLYFYSGYYSIRKLLKLEQSKKKCKILLSVYSVIIIILSRLPKDMIQMDKLFQYLGYLGTAYIAHIILCYTISFIKKPGGDTCEKAS